MRISRSRGSSRRMSSSIVSVSTAASSGGTLAAGPLPIGNGQARGLHRHLAVDVALRRVEVGDSINAFSEGDDHEQAPELVPALHLELPVLEAEEEAAEDRLQNVFGVVLV